jgi:hypothetical protein
MAQTDAYPRPATEAAELVADIDWRVGALSGAIATVVMGIAITITDLEVLRVTIAGLYGQVGLLAGWVLHVVHGTLFGLLFAAVLADPALEDVSDQPWRCVVAGAVFGVVLAVVGAGIIMPIWATVVGLEAASIPHITGPSLAWHLVYGIVLGAAFAALAD